MTKYVNPEKIEELKGLHFKAAYALDTLQMLNKNSRMKSACRKLEAEYAEAIEAIVRLHEEAAEQHREWLHAEFGDDLIEDKRAPAGALEPMHH